MPARLNELFRNVYEAARLVDATRRDFVPRAIARNIKRIALPRIC